MYDELVSICKLVCRFTASFDIVDFFSERHCVKQEHIC